MPIFLYFTEMVNRGEKCMNCIKTTLKTRPPRVQNSENLGKSSPMRQICSHSTILPPFHYLEQICLKIWLSRSLFFNLLIYVRNGEQGEKCINGTKTTLKPRPERFQNNGNLGLSSRRRTNMTSFKHLVP